jgi:uncharacterized DUF497 family protein
MEFGWDTAKNAWNVRHRRLPFALAALLFSAPTLEWEDDRIDYGEVRSKALGLVHGRVLLCVYTDRIIAGRDVRWIISLREAERKESDAYYTRVHGGPRERDEGVRHAAKAKRGEGQKASRRRPRGAADDR